MNFIDFFSGAGMFRKGMELAGHKCVGYVELDKFARKTYEANYNIENEWTHWDVQTLNASDIPKSDIWCFGFPCKNMSTANASTRYGLEGEQSGLFYVMVGLVRDIDIKPKYLFIENVKGFTTINGGLDFLKALCELHSLGYDIKYEVSSALEYGVPQNRVRTFLICKLNGSINSSASDKGLLKLKKAIDADGLNVYDLLYTIESNGTKPKIKYGTSGEIRNSIIEVKDKSYKTKNNYNKTIRDVLETDIDSKYYISEESVEGIVKRKGGKEKVLKDGKIWREGSVPFPDSIDKYARCITPSDGDANRSTHIIQDGIGFRKLTIRERARLQGLDDSFIFPVSTHQASLQLGNGVVVDVIRDIAKREII